MTAIEQSDPVSYRELAALMEKQEAKIDARFDKVDAKFDALVNKLDAKLDTHDSRLKSLENWRSWMAGSIAIIGFVLTVVIKIVSDQLPK